MFSINENILGKCIRSCLSFINRRIWRPILVVNVIIEGLSVPVIQLLAFQNSGRDNVATLDKRLDKNRMDLIPIVGISCALGGRLIICKFKRCTSYPILIVRGWRWTAFFILPICSILKLLIPKFWVSENTKNCCVLPLKKNNYIGIEW